MKNVRISAEEYLTQNDLKYHRDNFEHILERDKLDMCHLSNFLWNFPILKNYPGILGFEGAFKGVPAIVIGAGPSLEKNMRLLEPASKKALLISGDAALPILVNKLKIYPHFVVMGDPTDKQKFNFDGIDTTKFYTIVPSIVHPSIFRTVDPQHLAVYNVRSNSPLCEMIPYHIGRRGGLPAGVLTSGSVFMFALIMGCDPVTFVGHDLSWPTPDKVYADGVVKKKHTFQKNAKFKGGCLLFPDINGELVLTHETFLNFWIWLRDSIERVKTKVFNSSEAGILKMHCIRPMPLKEWIDRYCKYELVGMQEKIEKAYNYQYADGNVEKLLVPPLKVVKGK